MNKGMSVKTLVAIGIGAALFFVLGRFATIPVFANTSINLQYGVLALFAVLFGPIAGALIGLIGHVLIDLSLYGPWWSWIVSSGIVGLCIGFISYKIDIENGVFGAKQIGLFNVTQVITNLVAWGVIAPLLDIVIYKEPVQKVFTQGIIAGVSNSITTAIIGTILLVAYSKTRVKSGSLDKE